MSILVIDAGTSGVRAAAVESDGSVHAEYSQEFLPDSPAPGLVEFDAMAYLAACLAVARQVIEEVGAVDGVGISTQRSTAIVWDRATGIPVAPAQGWQDLRTVGDCLVLAADGLRFAPNQAATKYANIWNGVDPDRALDLCIGTPDSWLVWGLTEGRVHATDHTNAAVTGLLRGNGGEWDDKILDALRLPLRSLATLVDSSGFIGEATALDGSPPICGMAGDQQASLIGQGGVRPGLAKVTFGTGAMLNVCLGPKPPASASRGANGTFPIICWSRNGERMWGLEAIMLSAGTNVQWLRDDMGLIQTSAESATVAAECETSDGVVYVPAQLGLGTPHWDYGARGALFGLTRGSTRSHIVRAVLEGIAQRGADLLEAAEADADVTIETLRADGGMCENPVFCQAVANATQRRLEVAPVREATVPGAAMLASLALGQHDSWSSVEATWKPAAVYEPTGTLDRETWQRAIERSQAWYPDLSSLDF